MRVPVALIDGLRVSLRYPTTVLPLVLFTHVPVATALLAPLVMGDATVLPVLDWVDPTLLQSAGVVLAPVVVAVSVALAAGADEGDPAPLAALRGGFTMSHRMALGALVLGSLTVVAGALLVDVVPNLSLPASPIDSTAPATVVRDYALAGYLVVLAGALPLVLQFFPAALVVEDAGPVESLRRSYGLVSRNLASVLAFDLVALVVVAGSVGLGWGLLQASPDQLATVVPSGVLDPVPHVPDLAARVAGWLLLLVLLGALVPATLYGYYVAYFRRLTGAHGGSPCDDVALYPVASADVPDRDETGA